MVLNSGGAEVCEGCDKEESDLQNEVNPRECQFPCQCQPPTLCQPNVPLIQDGCGCCWQCARQENDTCDNISLCDTSKNLACLYRDARDDSGTCIVLKSVVCRINNKTYEDGETFLLDCRTQCTCKDGTYACVSLCPGEATLPGPKCQNARLVSIDGQCCREWRCEDKPDPSSTECSTKAGRWSDCSAPKCGLGLSHRWFIRKEICKVEIQKRFCQVRPCNHLLETEEELVKEIVRGSRKHHMRRSHMCKATLRSSTPVYLKIGSCISQQTYRPKICADCSSYSNTYQSRGSKISKSSAKSQKEKICCKIHSSTTIDVTFMCPLHAVPEVLRPLTKTWDVQELADNKNGAPTLRDPLAENNFDPYADLRPQELNDNLVDNVRENQSRGGALKLSDILKIMDEGQPSGSQSIGLQEPQPSLEPPRELREHYHFSPSRSIREKSWRNVNIEDESEIDDLVASSGLLKSPSSFGILAEDFTTTDVREYFIVKTDNHEEITHKVAWIIRCSCSERCNDLT